jgi:hypothetical protein
MTFGRDHYVPVVKVKRGEKNALQQIASRLGTRITPLLEIVERKPGKTSAQHLDTAFADLADSVQSYPRVFLDVRELAPDGPAAAVEAFRRATAEEISFTPITSISRDADVGAALAHMNNGLALRLTREEYEQGDLPHQLAEFVERHGLERSKIDLIADLGAVNELIVDGIAGLTQAFLADIPDHAAWRTFTLSACAFPLSMAEIERRSHELVERSEWIAWRDHLHRQRASLVRLPTFSDCAIQHPRGVEGFDPRIMQVSAAIRYALPEQWLLVKGESTRAILPSTQFPQLATRLVNGPLRSSFRGANHCEGCHSMTRAAAGGSGFGSAEVWRRLGTMHHISTAVEQLALLPWT